MVFDTRSIFVRIATLGLLSATSACVSPSNPAAESTAGVAPLDVSNDSLGKYSAADEAAYLARFRKLAEGGSGGAGLGAYDPLEAVPGASRPLRIPVAASKTLSRSALDQAEAYAAERNSSAFIVWRDGVIERESYFGDISETSPLVSKSLSKPMTALIVGRAIEQNYIESLDQPVADFISEWKGDPQKEKILVRHLLDMRSGFLPQGFARDPADVLNRAYLHPRHDEVIIHDYPLTHEPGTRYEYANATSEMVAPVIERATGMRYSEYVSTSLLQPLRAAGGSVWVNRPDGMAHSGCCMLLPARSFLKMGVLLLHDGELEGERLLPEGYVAEMREGTDSNPHYGLGLWLAGPYLERRGFAHPSVPFGKVLHSEPYADRDIYLFDGNGNQTVVMVPSMNMVILRMGGRPPAEAEWDNTFIPNMLIRDLVENGGEPLPEAQAK